MDGRGAPLITCRDRSESAWCVLLKVGLDGVVIKRNSSPQRQHKHLCADAGYTGVPALGVIQKHGYIAHVKGRGREARELKREPEKKTSRWVVEVAHSWFNRCRKLLVRYEKLDRSFLAFSVSPSGCEKVTWAL